MSGLLKKWSGLRSSIAWSEKLVDLMVVILGISIAFGVDKCSRNLQDEGTRSQYLKSLLIDLSKNADGLKEAREGIVLEERLVDNLLELTNNDDLKDGLEIAELFSRIGSGKGNFEAQEYVFESLKSNGGLALLNDSINIKLNRLHSQYRAVDIQQENLKLILYEYAVPIFFNYDSRKRSLSDPDLYESATFNNILLALSGNIDVRRVNLERTENYLSDIRSYIERTLAD